MYIMRCYLAMLYIQYCKANGIKDESFDFNNLSYEFLEWIARNELLVDEYYKYLLALGYLDNKTVALIDKGRYDYIKGDNITLISLFAPTLNLPMSDLLITNSLDVISENNNGPLLQDIILTYNPYFDFLIETNWPIIHNSQLRDISIGVFGSIYDKDREEKIKFIKEMSEKMDDDHRINYDTDNDKYFYTLNSKRKIK